MPWGKSFVKNLKPGQDGTTSNEIGYSPNKKWTHSSETEVNLINIDADVRKDTIKFDASNDIGSVTVAGPSAGTEVGFKSNGMRSELSAMAELSAARAEGTLNVTDKAALFGSANLNANTGAKIGSDGVEVNLLGFGVTMGVGGKWTINSPIGSVGGCNPATLTNTRNLYKRTKE